MSDLIYKTSEATRGGFSAIRKVEGLLYSMKRVPSQFTDSSFGGQPKDQVEVVLRDAVILEMEEGEPEPELKDGTFTFWLAYAAPGRAKAHKNSFYVKGFLASAETLGIVLPPDGTQRVTLEQREVPLGFKPQGAEEEATGSGFVFVGDIGGSGGEDIQDRLLELVVGKKPCAALRDCMLDVRVKHRTDILDAIREGTIGDILPVELDADEIYQKAESKETE